MSWLDIFRVEAEKRNAESAAIASAAIEAESARLAAEYKRRHWAKMRELRKAQGAQGRQGRVCVRQAISSATKRGQNHE